MILFINSKSEETCVGSMFLSDYIIILLLFFLQSNKLDFAKLFKNYWIAKIKFN